MSRLAGKLVIVSMKSLLETRRSEDRILFNAKLRTNLALLLDGDWGTFRKSAPAVANALIDIMSEIERWDLRVESISIMRSGRHVRGWASSHGRPRNRMILNGRYVERPGTVQKGSSPTQASFYLETQLCGFCKQAFFRQDGEPEDLKYHARGCRVVAVREVMEG